MAQPIRKTRTWAFAIALLAAPLGAMAARLGDIAVQYSRTNDVGNVGLASITFSVAPDTVPGLLTYLGDNVRYDMTVGQFSDNEGGTHKRVLIVYAGPTWQYQPAFLWQGGYIDLGTAVTYLSDSDVGNRNLGGHWQFTSHATLGHQFGTSRHWRLGLRLQHTSNAHIYPHNPGLDAVLVELAYRL